MPKVLEAYGSREAQGDPATEALFIYSVLECLDEEQAVAAIYAQAPGTYRGLNQDRPGLRIGRLAHDAFTVELPYRPPVAPELEAGISDLTSEGTISEFDTTAGTQHVTQCISQVDYGPEAAPDIRLARVVGLTRDGVDGVDVNVPKLEFGITKKINYGLVTSLYIKNLARLTGKVNIAPYSIGGNPFDAGELLFMGATGKVIEDGAKWEINFRFSASENRANIAVSDTINVVAKKGHEYLWVLYKKDEADNKFVEVPDVAFVSKLYEEIAFKSILGF